MLLRRLRCFYCFKEGLSEERQKLEDVAGKSISCVATRERRADIFSIFSLRLVEKFLAYDKGTTL